MARPDSAACWLLPDIDVRDGTFGRAETAGIERLMRFKKVPEPLVILATDLAGLALRGP